MLPAHGLAGRNRAPMSGPRRTATVDPTAVA
jgi:hypothetical protein